MAVGQTMIKPTTAKGGAEHILALQPS